MSAKIIVTWQIISMYILENNIIQGGQLLRQLISNIIFINCLYLNSSFKYINLPKLYILWIIVVLYTLL